MALSSFRPFVFLRAPPCLAMYLTVALCDCYNRMVKRKLGLQPDLRLQDESQT